MFGPVQKKTKRHDGLKLNTRYFIKKTVKKQKKSNYFSPVMNFAFFYLAFCAESDTDVVSAICQCGTITSHTTCDIGSFCWSLDNTCRSFGRCTIQDTVSTNTNCQCESGSASSPGCSADKYCIPDYVCSDTACNFHIFV